MTDTDATEIDIAEIAQVDPLEDLLGYQLRRMSSVLMAYLSRALANVGLRPTEASVLVVIAANASVTQSDIGRLLSIKRANMATLISGLDDRGLIQRKPLDGRSHALALTAKGRDLAVSARRIMDEHDAQYFASLCAEERALLQSLARRIRSLAAED